MNREQKLRNLILDIENELSSKLTGYKIQCKNKLFSALIYILRNYDYSDTNQNYVKYVSNAEKKSFVTWLIE